MTQSHVELNLDRAICIPGMVNVFVHHREEFVHHDKKVTRCMLYTKEVDWFWKLAVSTFNGDREQEINRNIFANDESYPEELQDLNPYHPAGYSVTVVKLKSEVHNIPFLLMKVYTK